jgi:CRISPR-associated protein Cas2
MGEDRAWYLVCYDIRDPKRWRRVFKLLKGYGYRLQYSIFRCRLTKRQSEQLRWELATLLDREVQGALMFDGSEDSGTDGCLR